MSTSQNAYVNLLLPDKACGPDVAFKAALEERIGAAKAACGRELVSLLVVTSRRVCCLHWARNPVEVCLDLLTQE